jgi:peptide/nickel transport system permease protein
MATSAETTPIPGEKVPAGERQARRPRRGFLLRTVVKRMGRALLVVLLVTLAVVSLGSLMQGSVAVLILGEGATPEAVAVLEAKLGLDQPLWERYGEWLQAAVQGDLGNSLLNSQPVSSLISDRLPVTVELALLGMAIALLLAVPMAILSAARPNGRLDRLFNGVSMISLAIPSFVAAPILIYLLALNLDWFPVTGWVPISEGLGANLNSALLPAFAIALTEVASFQRILRADLIATLGEDYVAAARARGMSPAYVILRHALRPSSLSLITLAGVNLGRLLGGTVVVEYLFALPGLGHLMTSSIASRDVVTVQGAVVFVAVAYVAINTLVDLSYGLLDPRVRRQARG